MEVSEPIKCRQGGVIRHTYRKLSIVAAVSHLEHIKLLYAYERDSFVIYSRT